MAGDGGSHRKLARLHRAGRAAAGRDAVLLASLKSAMQELTGRKLKVDEFKSVRSVGDVIDRVHAVLAE